MLDRNPKIRAAKKYPTNPDTIGSNQWVELRVLGGKGPYSWSVEGAGFSLEHDETYDRSNTLYADAIACGPATITVTDGNGDAVTGHVRCTAGRWVQIKDACPIPGPATDGDTVRIEGKYKVIQGYDWNFFKSGDCQPEGPFTCTNGGGNCYTRCENCDGGSGMGCVECITPGCPRYSYEDFPCCAWEPCSDGRYGEVRCYCTRSFGLYEWKCP